MKKTFRGVATALTVGLALFWLAGCTRGSKGEEKAELPAQVTSGVLTVGIIDGGDRFAEKKDGGFSGIEAEIARKLADDLELELRFVEAEDQEMLLKFLDEKKIDFAAGRFSEEAERAERYISTRNYGKGGYFLLLPRYCYIDNLAGLEGQSVGVSGQVKRLAEIAFQDRLMIKEYEDIQRMPGDLGENLIRAGILTEREALEMLQNGKYEVQVQEILNTPKEGYVYVLNKGNEALGMKLNETIEHYLDWQARPTGDGT